MESRFFWKDRGESVHETERIGNREYIWHKIYMAGEKLF